MVGSGHGAGVEGTGAAPRTRREPTARGYAAIALVTLGLTAVEVLLALAGAPDARALLVPLMLLNFAVGAAFYQGLWFDRPLNRAVFSGGIFFGILTFIGLSLLLGMGTVVRP